MPRASQGLEAVLGDLSRTRAATEEGVLWAAHDALDRMSLRASTREVQELAILLAGVSLQSRPFSGATCGLVETVLEDPLGALNDHFDGLSVGEARGAVGAIVCEALVATSLDAAGVDALVHAQLTYLTEGRGPAQRASRVAALLAARDASSEGDAAARALVVLATLDAYIAKFDGDGLGVSAITAATRESIEVGRSCRPKPRSEFPDATDASADISDSVSTELGDAEPVRHWSGRIVFEAADAKGVLLEVTVLAEAPTEREAHMRLAQWADEYATGTELEFPTGSSRGRVVRIDVIGKLGVSPLGHVEEIARHAFEVRDTAAFLNGSSRAAVVDW